MSLQNQNQNPSSSHPKSRRYKLSKEPASIDFCKIGGLSRHLKTLKEIIIFPLLHGNVFSHFSIKAPRGVLFYGPPGTGKTLVAAALATEINKEGIGKVGFFHRKGADVLDKWVGGSEKNLRDLFEKATKSRPSIIFFDELDGLAPVRDKQVDQIHSSVVATLLALMDGLDNKPGVIVIGATNRIEAIDPALRRPGRFDKELYFPLPGVDARREILEVHTASWKHKPSPRLISSLAEAAAGFSGADLQALCSEAIMACMKRVYPCLNKGTKIDPEKVKVDECDFLSARLNIVPSTQKSGVIMRKLTATVEPLLDGQLKKITRSIQTFWPHFLQEDYKYVIGKERYAGRVLLIGSNTQGLYSHIIPALLQQLEYLPSFVYDVTNIFKKNAFLNIVHNPCVILLSRVDEWWGIITDCEQLSIVSTLEDIHAGLPILVVATCRRDVPPTLQNFFYNNSSILLRIEDPKDEERKAFLKPLFYDRNVVSLLTVLENTRRNDVKESKRGTRGRRGASKPMASPIAPVRGKRRRESPSPARKRPKVPNGDQLNLVRSSSCTSLYDIRKEFEYNRHYDLAPKRCDSYASFVSCCDEGTPYFSRVLSSLLNQENAKKESDNQTMVSLKNFLSNKKFNTDESDSYDTYESPVKIDKNDSQMQTIKSLWNHASFRTSRNMTVAQLELLYDVISACINIHWNSFEELVKNLENILKNIELSSSIED